MEFILISQKPQKGLLFVMKSRPKAFTQAMNECLAAKLHRNNDNLGCYQRQLS